MDTHVEVSSEQWRSATAESTNLTESDQAKLDRTPPVPNPNKLFPKDQVEVYVYIHMLHIYICNGILMG